MSNTINILKKMGNYIRSSSDDKKKGERSGFVKAVNVYGKDIFVKGSKKGETEKITDFEKRSKYSQIDYYKENKKFIKRFDKYAGIMEKEITKKDKGFKLKGGKESSFDWVILLITGLAVLGGLISTKFKGIVKKIVNVVKIFSNVINALKGFGLLEKILKPFLSVFGKIGVVFKPFMKITTSVLKMTKVGKIFLGVGKFFGKFMKKIPIIGGVISIAEAVSRFMKGDVIGGIVDLAAAITGFIPGIGSVISIGLSFINMIRDNPKVVKKVAKVSIKIGGIFADFIKKYLFFVPPFYTIFKIGDAIKKFKSKDIKGGIADLGMGIIGLIPGTGNLFALVEGLFFSKRGKESKIGKVTFNIIKTFTDFAKQYLFFIPPIYTILKIGDALQKFKKKDIKGGIADLGMGILGIIPGFGGMFSFILGLFDSKKSKVGVIEKKDIGIFAVLDMIKDKIKNIIMAPIEGFIKIIDNNLKKDESGKVVGIDILGILNNIREKVFEAISSFLTYFTSGQFFKDVSVFIIESKEKARIWSDKTFGLGMYKDIDKKFERMKNDQEKSKIFIEEQKKKIVSLDEEIEKIKSKKKLSKEDEKKLEELIYQRETLKAFFENQIEEFKKAVNKMSEEKKTTSYELNMLKVLEGTNVL